MIIEIVALAAAGAVGYFSGAKIAAKASAEVKVVEVAAKADVAKVEVAVSADVKKAL
jgi:hypothetical protein